MEEEFKTLEYYQKSNDLFEFIQSNDLNEINLPPLLKKFRELLYSKDFRRIITQITGIKTVETQTDMFAAVYQDGHYLLPHDDELSNRVIAYIYYLVTPPKALVTDNDADNDLKSSNDDLKSSYDPWNINDGGTLDLYQVNQDNEPI